MIRGARLGSHAVERHEMVGHYKVNLIKTFAIGATKPAWVVNVCDTRNTSYPYCSTDWYNYQSATNVFESIRERYAIKIAKEALGI